MCSPNLTKFNNLVEKLVSKGDPPNGCLKKKKNVRIWKSSRITIGVNFFFNFRLKRDLTKCKTVKKKEKRRDYSTNSIYIFFYTSLCNNSGNSRKSRISRGRLSICEKKNNGEFWTSLGVTIHLDEVFEVCYYYLTHLNHWIQ